MKPFTLFSLLLTTLTYIQVLCDQSNTTKTTDTTNTTSDVSKTAETSVKDLMISELKALQDELNKNQRKVKYLETIRTVSQRSNQPIDANTLEEILTLQQHDETGGAGKATIPIQGKTSHDALKEKNEVMSFMNKILKKLNLELEETIKDIAYLPIKPTQRNQDEPAVSALIIFLTTQNYLLVYDINGNLLLAYKPGHQIKEFTVNPIADDYHIATLGTDNSIRVHTVNVTRVKDEDPMDVYSTEQKQKPNKGEKVKFRLDCVVKVEYIYDLEHDTIVPESLFQEVSTKRKDGEFGSLSSVIVRTQKFFAYRKGDNTLIVFHRNGTFKGTHEFPNDKFLTLQRFFPNPIYATQKTVGLFNPSTLEVLSPACDQPGENIIKLEVDQYSAAHFHVLTESGNILSYEFRQGTSQCKIVSRRSIGTAEESYSLHSAKSFLFAQKDKKGIDITAYNITELQPTSMDHIDTYQISLYPFKVDQDKVVTGKYVTARSGFSSSFVGTYFEFENGTSTFTLYEMTIVSKPVNDWLSNVRLPIIAIAILLVVGYQFYAKKNANPRQGSARDASQDPRRAARPGTAKGRARQNVDEMEREYSSQDYDSLKKELERLQAAKAAQGGRRNIPTQDEDSYYQDEYQEISTKKDR